MILLRRALATASILVSLAVGFAVTGGIVFIFSDKLFAFYAPALMSKDPSALATPVYGAVSIGILLLPFVIAVTAFSSIAKTASYLTGPSRMEA